jgi:hypothetical protein
MYYPVHELAWLSSFVLPCLNFGNGPSQTSSTTETQTQTTAGAGSPIVQGGGGANESTQSVGTSSIGVSGTGAKYLEQGATDLSGSQIGGLSLTGSTLDLSGGATLNIGDSDTDKLLNQIVGDLGAAAAPTVLPVSGGGGGGFIESVTPALTNVNWTLIALVGIAGLVLYLIFGRKKK